MRACSEILAEQGIAKLLGLHEELAEAVDALQADIGRIHETVEGIREELDAFREELRVGAQRDAGGRELIPRRRRFISIATVRPICCWRERARCLSMTSASA